MYGMVWVMVITICDNSTAGRICRTEVVEGHFQTKTDCNEIGKLMKDRRVSYFCYPTWEKKI